MRPQPPDVAEHRRLGLALAALCVIGAAGLSSCGGEAKSDGSSAGPSPTVPTNGSSGTDAATTFDGESDPILIKTSIDGPTGKVVAGSVLRQSAFCPGGTVRHDRGSPEIGFPAVNVFSCADGQLKIGFGPGREQMSNSVQTSDWKILTGSGRFAGLTGNGQMIVQWSGADSTKGQETFVGRVDAP